MTMRKLSNIIESQTITPQAPQSAVNGFAILKPGFLDHAESFIKTIENSGWNIIHKKKTKLTDEQAAALYSMHEAKPFYNDLCKYMCSGDCLCLLCSKDTNDPVKDMTGIKDNIRKEWGKDEMRNAMHSSDSLENVKREANIVFNDLKEAMDEYNWAIAPTESPETTTLDDVILKELLSLVAEEINAFYQYFIVAPFLVGRERPSIQKKYAEYAEDELNDHAVKLLERINQLGFNPGLLTNLYSVNTIANAKYIIPDGTFSTDVSLLQNIEAETAAIDHYTNVIKLIGDNDPVTSELLKDILADEVEHRTELEEFYNDITQSHQY